MEDLVRHNMWYRGPHWLTQAETKGNNAKNNYINPKSDTGKIFLAPTTQTSHCLLPQIL
jgi:hypothetical protein